MSMRIGIAMMSHETNTFSPVVTDLARFSGGREVPLHGADAVRVFTDTASCLGGARRLAKGGLAGIAVEQVPLKEHDLGVPSHIWRDVSRRQIR